MTKPPLFTNIIPPNFQLSSPEAILSERDFDLLRITVEDFRFVTRDIAEDLTEVAADIRARSTILRRLLCENDLFSAGRLFQPKSDLRVRARMLDFDPLHPGYLITCGNYPWANDRLQGMATEFSIQGVQPAKGCPWGYREDADVSLTEYLEGLAIGVLGTPVRRRQVVKYVADKKAAHVSDRRKHVVEQALDRAWSNLFITIVASTGQEVRLNLVYLEVLALIKALADSESINQHIDELDEWLSTARITYPDHVRPMGMSFRIDPIQ